MIVKVNHLMNQTPAGIREGNTKSEISNIGIVMNTIESMIGFHLLNAGLTLRYHIVWTGSSMRSNAILLFRF